MVLGEIAAFGKHADTEARWGMSVRAVNHVSVLTLTRSKLQQVMHTNPGLALDIKASIARSSSETVKYSVYDKLAGVRSYLSRQVSGASQRSMRGGGNGGNGEREHGEHVGGGQDGQGDGGSAMAWQIERQALDDWVLGGGKRGGGSSGGGAERGGGDGGGTSTGGGGDTNSTAANTGGGDTSAAAAASTDGGGGFMWKRNKPPRVPLGGASSTLPAVPAAAAEAGAASQPQLQQQQHQRQRSAHNDSQYSIDSVDSVEDGVVF